MAVEELGEQFAQPLALGGAQAGQQLVLGSVGVLCGAQAGPAGPVVAVSTLEPKKGQRDHLLALPAEFAPQIRAEPGCLRYSVHAMRGDDHGPLLVVQVYASIEAYTAHSAAIAVQIPRLSALLQTPPAPPALYGLSIFGHSGLPTVTGRRPVGNSQEPACC